MQTIFFLRQNGKFVRINFHEIVYAQSCKNYVRIVTVNQQWMALLPMKDLEEHLPPSMFCRVHRSYIVSLEHIMAFDHSKVYLKDAALPIGEQFKAAFQGSVRIVMGESRAKMAISVSGMAC